MTCSARIPVYTLIISAFIPDKQVWGWVGLQGLVMFGLYAAGIFSALAVSFVANHFFWRENATPPFMIELPDYKMPRLPNVAMGLYMRAMMFLKRAGTTIFSMMVLIWFLASFPRPPAGATSRRSISAWRRCIGRWIEPVLAPVGFNWQISVALDPRHGRARSCRGLRSAPSTPSRAARKRRRRSARRWPANGVSPPRCRCWSGTFSRRNAPPRWR